MARTRDKILKTAEKLVQKGKLEPAIREFEKLLELTPDDTNTINRLGDLHGRVGNVDRAVELYERVAEKFAGQGFLPKAIAIYKKINRLVPQRLDIFERLGELYHEQGLVVEAKSQFQMLVEHYAKSGDTDGAIRVSQRLADIDPNDSTARLKLADLLLEEGDSEQAITAYGALGESLLERGQLDEAERLYRRLLDRELADGEIMVAVCNRLLDANRSTAAQELLSAGLEASPDSIPLQTLQVRASMAMGETDAAVELAERVLEVDPDNSEVRSLVGSFMLADGDQQEATEMMIPAAEALLEKADYSRAQQMLRELAEIAPDDERVLRLAIRAFRPSGDQDMITKLTASLAGVCFDRGEEDQARRLYLELVASDPTNELYRKRLAQLDGAAVDESGPGAPAVVIDDEDLPSEISFPVEDETGPADAVPPAEPPDAADFDPDERINEASVFAKYGLNDKAVSHLEDVIRRAPDHAAARQALADLYLATGRSAEAVGAIEPVVAAHRSAGDDEAADQLAAKYGITDSGAAEEDDEIIIVEIDGDETDADELEIDLGVGPTESGTTPDAVPGADELMSGEVEALTADSVEPEPEPEPEVVDEELVEISGGIDGPSFNELAQLDLFIDQELFEDALKILDRLETDFPDDPDLAKRRQQLAGVTIPEPVEQAEEEVSEIPVTPTGTPTPEPVAEPPAPQPEPVPAAPVQSAEPLFGSEQGEDFVDLAKELEAELAEEEAMVEEATGRGKGEALLDEVFKEFQKGVAEQLSEEDSDTHFNLGIAYKEMGLLEEAIAEFQVASHDPVFFVEACSMIGVCANELGKHMEAAEWYQKALVAPDLSSDARTALRYELAVAYERIGDYDQAIELFEQIVEHDPGFRDVGARLSALTGQQRQAN
jgi:tetratricopeptide (TPR) repeat protein